MKKPKVLFRADGNTQIGMGHFYRSFSLACMLHQDFEVLFATYNPSSDSQRVLESKEHIEYIPLSHSTDHAALQVEELMSHSPDIVVLDGYHFTEAYKSLLRQTTVALALIDDAGEGVYHADMLINTAPMLRRDNYKVLSTPASPRILLGLQYLLLRPEFLEASSKEEMPKADQQTKRAFICFGGADPYELAAKATALCIRKFNLEVDVVIPQGYPGAEALAQLQKNTDLYLGIHTGLSAAEMKELMLRAAIGIVPSSSIIFECLSVGLPVISGFYVENQRKLYEGLKEKRMFTNANRFEEQDLVNALESLLYQGGAPLTSSTLIDGAKIRSRYIKKFMGLHIAKNTMPRKASEADMKTYFEWANDPYTRSLAFNPNPIPWENHVKWFRNRLASPLSYLVILSCHHQDIGQVRFDFLEQDNEWEISYLLDKDFRGYGLGADILKISIDMLHQEYPNAPVMGKVMHPNIASATAFRYLGFTESTTEEYITFRKK